MIDARIPIEGELARRGIKLRRSGQELIGPCPVCGGADRFSINTKKKIWNCRGCAKGGDVIALVQHIDGCDFRTAVRTLGIEERPDLPPPPMPSPAPPQPRKDDNGKRALGLWWRSVPIASTRAETYLRSRGLQYDDPDGEVLRFHPHCPFGGQMHSCMVGLFRTIEGNRPVAIHRTALTPEGRKIDRMTLGPIGGAAIKFTANADVTMGLHVGEGIETTLAGMMPPRNFRPAWALGSAGGIAKFPVLAGIEALTVLVDHDKPDRNGRQAGHAAAQECGERWKAAGQDVFYVIPDRLGDDMADVVIGGLND
jgi:hypothetical protein